MDFPFRLELEALDGMRRTLCGARDGDYYVLDYDRYDGMGRQPFRTRSLQMAEFAVRAALSQMCGDGFLLVTDDGKLLPIEGVP